MMIRTLAAGWLRFADWRKGRRSAAPRRVVVLSLALLAGAALLVAGIGASSLSADGAKSAINTIGSEGVAIRGYDPVAYFTDGGPRKGQAAFSVMHGGAEWRFSSAENRDLFKANPEKYQPAYGGYCAYGVAKGGLYKIEPDAWSIRGGKLYLNYDRSVQATWAKQPDQYIESADRKWPGLAVKK